MSGFLISLVAFLVLITVVVVVHEGGHFVVARLSGIGVEEFAVGFGPRVASVQREDTVYSIRALPVGGFVKMPGMLGLEGESDMGERNFNRASLPRRAATIVAGVGFNLVFGALCLAVVAAQPIPSTVAAGNPAANAGLVSGDTILSEAGMSINYSSLQTATADFQAADQASGGRPISVVYRAPNGSIHTAVVTPELMLFPNVTSGPLPSDLRGPGVDLVVTAVNGSHPGTGDPGGRARRRRLGHHLRPRLRLDHRDLHQRDHLRGAGWRRQPELATPPPGGSVTAPPPRAPRLPRPCSPASRASLPTSDRWRRRSARSLPSHPRRGMISAVRSGSRRWPGSAVQQGWVEYVYVIGWISLALGFVNVLPIPFLDGGRLLFIGIEAVRRRQIDPKRQAAAIAVSLGFIILVVVLITISDVSHLTSGGPP